MKLVQKSLTPCIAAISAALTMVLPATFAQDSGEAAYLAFYNPAKGFTAAQTNLTSIFLQVAGSLECHGSPEPYIRHMQAEHVKIAKAYEAKTGHELQGHWPAYMTDEYLDTLIVNWNGMSAKLHLDNLAKDAGFCTRKAIKGTREVGTILVGIFNRHQDLVARALEGGPQNAGFEQLKATLTTELEFDKEKVDMRGYEGPRRDAVSYALVFDGTLAKLFRTLDTAIGKEKSAPFKTAIRGAFIDLGQMAHSELEIGLLETALR